VTDLGARIAAAIGGRPGITTNVLCREEVKVRKADVLVELERLVREGVLRFETGERASKCWYLLAGRGNQFLTCSWGTPDDGDHLQTETAA
jgi:hypothetical protein